MGRFMPLDDEEVIQVPGAGTFTFSAKKIEKLGAMQYTVVTIAVDVSGSVTGFADQLLECVKNIVEACRKNQRAEFMVIRLITFGSTIQEIHGFRELVDINIDDYDEFDPTGMTLLFDGAYDAIGSVCEYAKMMSDKDYDVNGAVYIITDGDENPPSGHKTIASPRMMKEKVEKAIQGEEIESLITVLVGLHDPMSAWAADVQNYLSTFQVDANFTKFIDVGDASPQNLAKLADWVSDSISSQSSQVGSNQPSQVLDF